MRGADRPSEEEVVPRLVSMHSLSTRAGAALPQLCLPRLQSSWECCQQLPKAQRTLGSCHKRSHSSSKAGGQSQLSASVFPGEAYGDLEEVLQFQVKACPGWACSWLWFWNSSADTIAISSYKPFLSDSR